MPTDPESYLFVIALIASTGAAIATLEWIACRPQLRDDGLFSWRVISTRDFAVGTDPFHRILNWTLSYGPFLGLLVIRFIALVALPATFWLGRGQLPTLAVIIATSLLMHFRSPWGMDGSDQMVTQVFGALFLSYLAGTRLAYQSALWFIALQACLSYGTAGVAKALSKYWHEGKAVFAIFNTRTYGYEPIARFLIHREAMTKALTWTAVLMEAAFPLALLAGYPGCLLFIGWGVAFHLMNAGVMGLNSFLWAFVATYPAVIYCAVVTQHFLGWG
jgi:hypothetical protein